MDFDLPGIARVISCRLQDAVGHSRPNLDSTLARVVVTDNVHMRLCKLDDASLLQLLYGLCNLCGIEQIVNRIPGNRLRRPTEEAAHIFDVCAKPHWASSQR